MRIQVLVLIVVAATILPTVALGQPSDDSARRALSFFQTLLANGPNAALERFRTDPPNEDERKRAYELLPPEGTLEPTPEESTKLRHVMDLFRHRGRGDIVILLIDIPQAFVGLHAKAILLVSRPALALMTAEESQALAAHELGHDTMWDDYWGARSKEDWATLRGVELRCDGIAVLALASFGTDPAALGRAVERVTRFNATLGATADGHRYPAVRARLAFIEEMTAMTMESMERLTRR